MMASIAALVAPAILHVLCYVYYCLSQTSGKSASLSINNTATGYPVLVLI